MCITKTYVHRPFSVAGPRNVNALSFITAHPLINLQLHRCGALVSAQVPVATSQESLWWLSVSPRVCPSALGDVYRKRPPQKERVRKDILAYSLIICIISSETRPSTEKFQELGRPTLNYSFPHLLSGDLSSSCACLKTYSFLIRPCTLAALLNGSPHYIEALCNP